MCECLYVSQRGLPGCRDRLWSEWNNRRTEQLGRRVFKNGKAPGFTGVPMECVPCLQVCNELGLYSTVCLYYPESSLSVVKNWDHAALCEHEMCATNSILSDISKRVENSEHLKSKWYRNEDVSEWDSFTGFSVFQLKHGKREKELLNWSECKPVEDWWLILFLPLMVSWSVMCFMALSICCSGSAVNWSVCPGSTQTKWLSLKTICLLHCFSNML